GLDAQLVDAGPAPARVSARRNQTRGARHQRDGSLRAPKVGRRCGFVECVSNARMYDATAVRFADRVLNARRLQVERVIVRERQQIETQRLERIERRGWREKSTALARGLAR